MEMIFKTAESAVSYVRSISITGERFELSLANDLTIQGRPDEIGAGMAIILDAILAQGYQPDGMQQQDGYRVYSYVPME